MAHMKELIRPGTFGAIVAADSRREEFDHHNEVIVSHEIPVDFVFIGDSITHWWDTTAYFGRSGRYIVNRGIDGDTTEYVLRRFTADVIQLRPKYVITMIGVNNTWSLDAWEIKDRTSPEQLIPGILRDIDEMLKLAVDARVQPVLCSILPLAMDTNKNDGVRNELIIEANRGLRQLATKWNAVYVDYHSKLVDQSGRRLRADLADDGIHPGVIGYDIMAKVLRNSLTDVGIEI